MRDLTNNRTLRHDMGGRFLGDPRAFLLIVPLWWGLSLLGVAGITDAHVFWPSTVANTVAFAATFGLLLIFRRTWFRHRMIRPVPPLQVLAAGAVLGATKSSVVAAVTAWSVAEPDYGDMMLWRIPAGAFTGAWIVPILAIVLATRARYQAQRDILIAELLRKQFLAEPRTNGLRVEDPTDARVRAVISEAKDILAHTFEPPERTARKLRALIDTKLRPLSHELWADTSRKYTDFSLRDLLRMLLVHHRYWVLPTTVFIMMTNGPFLIPMMGWAEGLGRLAITTTLAFLLLLLLSVKSRPGIVGSLFLLISGTIVFALLSELIAFSIFGPSATRLAFVSGLGNAVLFFTTTITLGIARVAHQDKEGIRSELEKLLGNSTWQGQLTVEQDRLRHREVAELLHGRVQNRLLSVVLALTSRPLDQKHDDFAAELEVIEDTLFGLKDAPEKDNQPTTRLLDSEVAQLAARWAGIIAVSTVNDVAEEIAHPWVTVVGRVGEEAISNAVRHGLASAVSVRVEKSGDDIVLTVADNGVGPRSGHPGLGSLYLTQVAGRRWSLEPGVLGSGSLLTARLQAPPMGDGSF